MRFTRQSLNWNLKKEAEHEHNILDMTQVDEYKSPWKNKDASTINNLAYYESNEHKVEIIDSSKQVEASKETIIDTHIVDRVRNLSVGTTSVDSAVSRVGIIGLGGCGITQVMNHGVTSIISRNVIKNVLKNSS